MDTLMHIPVKYLRRSRQLQHWQLSAICSSGSPAYLRWIAAQPPQVGAKCKSSILVQFQTLIFRLQIWNCGEIGLLSHTLRPQMMFT